MPRAPSKTEESRPLTPKQRSFLRGLGHTLDPVVLLGHGGLSEGVVLKAEAELENHELIKVRVGGNSAEVAADVGAALAVSCKAELVQVVGHTALLYRRRKKDPTLTLPRR